MKNKYHRLIFTSLVVFSSSAVIAADDALELFKKIIPKDTLFDLKGSNLNGFNIESYRAKEIDKNFKTTKDIYSVIKVYQEENKEKSASMVMVRDRESKNSVGVSVMPAGQTLPIVNVVDQDGDGQFDLLSYSVTDKDGNNYMEVIDYDMDGQPDFRVNLRDGISEVWFKNRWNLLKTDKEHRFIVVDGKELNVVTENNRPVVK